MLKVLVLLELQVIQLYLFISVMFMGGSLIGVFLTSAIMEKRIVEST